MATAAATMEKICPQCGGAFEAAAVFCPKDGTKLLPESDELPPDTDPYIGTLISGDIEIRSVAGAGAMGRVYRAHQRGIDRDVAVKILHRELSGNTQLVQRFHREAKIASKLQHPHVVEVYLAGQLPDRALYIVMEYLDGLSLAAALTACGGRFPIERALAIAIQICDAVGEGHARGIVHRDLKPENVMLVRRAEVHDWVKVLDFGIAKVSLGEQSMETQAGLIFGTARYISPEGAQGTTVKPPGDVYSLATIVYQMLAGRTPFDAEQPVGLLIKHIHDTPPPLRSMPHAESVPEGLARVIMDNLAKDPAQRAPSARAFASSLAAAAKEANISFSDVGVVARLSQVDVAVRLSTLDPTIDDAAAMPGFSLSPSPLPAPAIVSPRPEPTVRMRSEPPVQASPATDEEKAPPSSRGKSERRRGGIFIVALAFLLGAALAALVMQNVVHRRDAEREEHVAKARRALGDDRYTHPPGDNVRDLLAAGEARWPGDPALHQIRSDTAHALVTRAMATRSTGDLRQARDIAKTATDFDPTDHAAKILLEKYDEELRQKSVPRATVDAPARARRGQRAELSSRVLVGDDAPRARVENARFIVTGPGLPAAGTVLPASSSSDGGFRAELTPPRAGEYKVVFEASTEGASVRAERSLGVD
ncbi:MAG: serine/threonine protein kinase [Labilithrix sp.]|nr:serine/threonine protein kinase [Labilithrix sp.]